MAGMPETADRGLVLLGGGGHARSVADAAVRAGKIVLAVVDPTLPEGWDVPVVADLDQLDGLDRAPRDAAFLVAVGSNAVREREAAEVDRQGLAHATLVASTATVGGTLGAGTQVLEHAHVGPGAVLGRGVIVNTAAVVEHDVVIGDHSHVAPGARLLGGARIGARVLVGAGAVVLPSVGVGAGAVIGAGSVVTRDVPAGARVAGVPARVR